MKIISPFRDYYDSAQGFGVDPSVVYVRTTREYPTSEPTERWQPYRHTREYNQCRRLISFCNAAPEANFLRKGAVSFCGKAYPFWTCSIQKDGSPESAMVNRFFWNREEVVKFYEERPSRSPYVLYDRWGYQNDFSERSFRRFLAEHPDDMGSDMHRALDAPVIMVREWDRFTFPEIVANPRLYAIEFARVVDPFQAFQRLAMFLGNDMVHTKAPDFTSDETRRDSHGFDGWSFKRHPNESKKPRHRGR